MKFTNPIAATEDLIREQIKSPDYVPGVSGWIIRRDGTAEFNNLIARGSIVATELDIDQGGRGRIHIHYDDVNLEPEAEWFIGQDNIDDQWGVPGQITQTAPARLVHDIATSSGRPNFTISSGSFNGSGSASINIRGPAFDDSEGAEVTIGESGLGNAPGVFRLPSDWSINSNAYAPEVAILETDSSRQIVDDSTFGADFDCSVVISRAGGSLCRVTVDIWVETRTISGATCATIMGYEIRDTNSAGTLRVSASDARAAYGVPGITGFHSASGHFTETVGGTSSLIYVRLMFRNNVSVGTTNPARARIEAHCAVLD